MRKPTVLFLHCDSLYPKEMEKISIIGHLLFSSNLTEAFQILRDQNVSCLVVNPDFNSSQRLEEIKQFRRFFETTPIIFYSQFREPDLLKRTREIGIGKFSHLDAFEFEELLQGISAVIERCSFQPNMKIFEINLEKCSPRIKKVCKVVAEEFWENPTVEQIASRFSIHPSHLEREWHREIKRITIKQLLIGCKLLYSTFLMQNDGLKLKHIARLSGFANEHEFYGGFHRHMGITASTYRKLYRFDDFYAVYWRYRKTPEQT